MTDGLVSVIIPVFNRPGMLQKSVASVLRQTHAEFEIIIVDDGSTDTTPAVIAELCSRDPRIRSVRRANGGPGLARETGRVAARGQFIQYLDSDDILLPLKLEMEVAALRAHPEAGIAYGPVVYRDAQGREIACHWKRANQKVTKIFPSFLLARWWETVAPLYRRTVTDAAGPWTALRLEEDWEYDARMGRLGVVLVFVETPAGEHCDHAQDRLSRGGASDPLRLRDRAEAHLLIADHAHAAGTDPLTPEFQSFARELFHLARQCGAAGLHDQSSRLLAAARRISSRLDLRLYAMAADFLGARRTARIAAWTERLGDVFEAGRR